MCRHGRYVQPLSKLAKVGVEGSNPFARSMFFFDLYVWYGRRRAHGISLLLSRNLVGERGFEPPAPASRRQCSTGLSYSPTDPVHAPGGAAASFT